MASIRLASSFFAVKCVTGQITQHLAFNAQEKLEMIEWEPFHSPN
jgi:hypothetical protein